MHPDLITPWHKPKQALSTTHCSYPQWANVRLFSAAGHADLPALNSRMLLQSRRLPVTRWCACHSNMTSLLGEPALFSVRVYQCNCPVAPSDLDRLVSGYRLTQADLTGKAALFIPGHESNSPVVSSGFDRLISGYALYRDTASLRDPYFIPGGLEIGEPTVRPKKAKPSS